MRYSIIFLFLLFYAHHLFAASDTIVIKRASNNAVYVPDASKLIPPGSVVQLQGDYLYYKVLNVQGTADRPIIFVNKGLVRIGGFKPYTFQIQGQHFIINGSGDSNYKYGFLLNYDTTVVGSSYCFCPNNSTDFEMHHVEMMNAAEGVLQNPAYGGAMNNIYYHHLYIHDLNDPYGDQPGRSEAFYLGNTKDTIPYNAPYDFHNCRIEDCYMHNLTGDGIQVSNGTFVIRRDTVVKYGTAHVAMQDNGVQVGQCASAIIDSVILDSSSGIGMQVLGIDSVIVTNCVISHIPGQSSLSEDVIYLNGKGPVPLNMRFQNNIITASSGRHGINSITQNAYTNGSIFINNHIDGIYTTPYWINKAKDQWIMNPVALNRQREKVANATSLLAHYAMMHWK